MNDADIPVAFSAAAPEGAPAPWVWRTERSFDGRPEWSLFCYGEWQASIYWSRWDDLWHVFGADEDNRHAKLSDALDAAERHARCPQGLADRTAPRAS